MAVPITRRCGYKVSSLAIERVGNIIRATFKVPASMTSDDYNNRATWIDHELRMDRAGVKPVGLDVGESVGPGLQRTDADRFWIRGQGIGASIEKNYDRNRFHPVSPGRYCKKVSWGTFGGNSKAGSGWGTSMPNIGPVVWATRTVGLPRKPVVTWTYDKATSKATVTIKTDAGSDWYERYDTMYQVTIRKADGKEATLRKWGASRATEIKSTFDLSPYLGSNMASGKYVAIKCQAYARGMAGDNPAKANAVTATRYVAWPSPTTIGSIQCTSKAQTARITIPITSGSFAATTQLQLQRRNGIDGSWSDVSGATDNGDAKALYDVYADANPQPGEYVYYRVKSTRDQYTQYSAAKRADCLFTAKPKTTCSATVGIVSVTPGSSGTAATVVMGWSDSTANTGWEMSWSDYKGAWNATTGPSVDSGTDRDATSATSKYKATKTKILNGLTAGKTYYVRVRRYREVDGATYYSAYSSIFSFVTESARDDRCGIISMAPWANGTACTVVVGYTEDYANQLTELSWSTSSGAWSSASIDPSSDTFPTAGENSSTKWKKQVTLYLQELTSGTTYYVRARRCKTDDGTTTGTIVSYTPYSDIQNFRTESAANDECGIISIEPSTTGKTAKVVVGFKENNPNTGTELQWSTDSAAWQSNVPPESLNATWPRKEYTGSNWTYYQNIYLRNLTPGKTYYAYARRYFEAGGNTTHTPWSKQATFKTPRVTATNDTCGIVSITRHSDGLGANVVVGWTEDTANEGTELTWSTDEDAWHSNQQPSSLQATWSDKNSRSNSWKKTQLISLHGLERGETYYIRARRYRNDDEGETFSPYATTCSITLPLENSDNDVRCGLVSVTGQSDGTSAVVVVGWDGDHTGCEVSWSTDPNAWESSDRPSTMTLDWQDAESKSEDWSHTSTCYLRGLQEGVTHYVKARSYYEHNGTTWSDYTGDVSVTPYGAPLSVALNAPEAVARGEAIECYWAIASEMDQKEWHIHEEGHPNVSLAEGGGTLCYGDIPPEKYEGRDSINFYVSAGCGGELTDSNIVSVGIANYPSCEIACADTLTAQPLSFEVYTDNDASTLIAALYADGVTISAPDGDKDQLRGDAVWSDIVTAEWTSFVWGNTLLYAQLLDAVDAAQNLYDSELESADFEETDDVAVRDGVSYYEALPDSYALIDPISAVSPSSEGWYQEENGVYVLTSDSSVISGKVYYVRSGSGTSEDPYIYDAIDPVSIVDPSEEGWFVIADEDKASAVSNCYTDLRNAEASLAAHPSDEACAMASVVLPDSLDIWDGASYTLSVKTVEPVAELASDTAVCGFNVAWAHQAVSPRAELTVDQEERSVSISLTPPNDAVQGDLCDVYRMSPMGYQLVAESIPLDGEISDPYAPFGFCDLNYRILLRTTDGDFAFDEFPYTMKVVGSRFDWDGKFVELPYNLDLSEGYQKDYEARTHSDGSVNGYYGPAVGMSFSLSSDVVKVDYETLKLLREMANYPGPVFCRSQNGLAFQGNVELSELGTTYNNSSLVSPISLDITYENLTDQYKCNGGGTV